MIRPSGAVAAVAALLLLTTACDHADLAASTIVGHYTLRSVNGAPPPFRLPPADGATQELLEDSYDLNRGDTWSRTTRIRITRNGQTTTETSSVSGTYATQGVAIFFTRSDGVYLRLGNIEGKSIKITEENAAYVYRK